MQVNIFISWVDFPEIYCFFLQLFNRAYCNIFLLTCALVQVGIITRAAPYRERCAPISIPGERPVTVFLKPVAEAACACFRGEPVNFIVQLYHALLVAWSVDVPAL